MCYPFKLCKTFYLHDNAIPHLTILSTGTTLFEHIYSLYSVHYRYTLFTYMWCSCLFILNVPTSYYMHLASLLPHLHMSSNSMYSRLQSCSSARKKEATDIKKSLNSITCWNAPVNFVSSFQKGNGSLKHG